VDPYRVLHPDKIEFTFCPRSDANKNRSRLDFFIISDCLLDILTGCDIAGNLQNKLFDHKAVNMNFNDRQKNDRIRPTISNKDLDDDLIEFVGKTVVIESYVIHCDLQFIKGVNRNLILNTCGILRQLIRECGPDPQLCIGTDITENTVEDRNRKLNRIRFLSGSLTLQEFENVELNIGPDISWKLC
jgi:hypothetical protein